MTTPSTLRATAEQISRLSRFSSCEISDSLVKLGSKTGGHLPDLEQLSKGREERVVGEAYTVQMVALGDDAPSPNGHYVDLAPSGSVMVISSPPTVKNASLGGLLALSASVRGVKGAVISGRVRDLAEIRELSFPIYARGHSTLGQSPFTRPSAVQVPIEIKPHGDTDFPSSTVYPFDIVVADTDGVVIVRPQELEDVVAKADKGKEVDEKCRLDLLQGKGVAETFKKWRGK